MKILYCWYLGYKWVCSSKSVGGYLVVLSDYIDNVWMMLIVLGIKIGKIRKVWW